MTKNPDVSWIPTSVGCSLKRFTTAELAAELATRDGVDCDSVKSMWEYRIEKEPLEEYDDPNIYNSWDDSDNPSSWSGICGEGPCKILVVRE